ncbi:MAG: hypothetical protein ABIB43_05785 [archaeon]
MDKKYQLNTSYNINYNSAGNVANINDKPIDGLVKLINRKEFKVDENKSTKTFVENDIVYVTLINNDIVRTINKYSIETENNLELELVNWNRPDKSYVGNFGMRVHIIYETNNLNDSLKTVNTIKRILDAYYSDANIKKKIIEDVYKHHSVKNKTKSGGLAEKVAQAGISKDPGFMYFLDRDGDVSRTHYSRGNRHRGGNEKVKCLDIKREPGYLYFIDKEGDVARTKIRRK